MNTFGHQNEKDKKICTYSQSINSVGQLLLCVQPNLGHPSSFPVRAQGGPELTRADGKSDYGSMREEGGRVGWLAWMGGS